MAGWGGVVVAILDRFILVVVLEVGFAILFFFRGRLIVPRGLGGEKGTLLMEWARLG